MNKWKLGTFFGIGVYVHWTFLLLVLWVLLTGGGFFSLLFIIAIFASVVAHEYGHALTARQYGIGTRDITLYPIGGVAALRSMPKKPSQEIAVALAGPAVNIAIAFVLALYLLVTGSWSVGFSTFNGFIAYVMVGNIVLAAFNLIPAFPMDGGRVLRAWLARTQDYATATDKAAKVGRFFALVFAVIALVNTNFFLLILAGFIYLAAGAERRQAYLERDARRFGFSFGGVGGDANPGGFPDNQEPSRPKHDPEVIDIDAIYTPRR